METENTKKINTIINSITQLHSKNTLDFENLAKDVNAHLKLDEFTLLNEAYANTEKHHDYITKLFRLRRQLGQIEQLEKILYKLLWKYYSEESELVLRTREDKERHIQADENWIKLKSIMNEYENLIEYLEKVDKLFSERSYSISTAARILGGG